MKQWLSKNGLLYCSYGDIYTVYFTYIWRYICKMCFGYCKGFVGIFCDDRRSYFQASTIYISLMNQFRTALAEL